MVYISSTGEVLEKEPLSWKTPLKALWKIISFLVEFLLSMFGLEHLWRESRVNRYFTGGSSYYFDGGDDRGSGNSRGGWFSWGGGGGGGRPGGPGGPGSGGGGGGLSRRIHTLPRNSGMGVPSCPGGACGR